MIKCKITATASSFLSNRNTGLGNVLFQISSTIGLAIKHNKEYSFPDLLPLIERLKLLNIGNHIDTIYRNIPTRFFPHTCYIHEKKSEGFDEILDKQVSVTHGNLYIGDYLQSHLYFDKYRNKILDIFSIDQQSNIYIKNKYPELFNTEYTPIAIHIRQNYGGDVFYTIDEYVKMIKYVQTKTKNQLFFICSDNIEWCKNNIPIELNVIFVQDNPDYIDMWIMSLCQHNIICHSTLGWWGAYLNNNKNKIVIYPEKALRREALHIHEKKIWEYRKYEHYLPDWFMS